MTAKDVAAVDEIERVSFSDPWSRESYLCDVAEGRNENAVCIVADDSGIIRGYADIWVVADEAQIMRIASHPEFLRRGVGSMLLSAGIAAAKSRGAKRMTLEVRPSNTAAVSFYEKHGFENFGRRPHYYVDNGEDAIIMWNMKI